ncbi:MAG: NUDIX hydrolase [Pseudomonadota bacterium]|nr:NUDIX hydrolase [Pseudomonadota bacterium]
MWQGKYITAVKRGQWEYVERAGRISAVVILAEHDGQIVLVEQERVAIGGRCLELPAGLIGDDHEGDDHDGDDVESAARRELAEETGYSATHIELLGEYYSSPGMVAESFSLVRATGLSRMSEGGGVDGEDIITHLVPRAEIAAFIAAKRAEGVGIDVKLLVLLGAAIF